MQGNKPSLNYSKTNYKLMCKNKSPKINNSQFEVYINQSLISRASLFKYLDVYNGKKMSWSSNENHFAKKFPSATKYCIN